MSEELGTSDIARLLGISRPRVWQLRKDPTFPKAAGRDEQGREYWYEAQILRWVAGTTRGLADKAPLLYRPASGAEARYLGTSMVDGYVVLRWDSELGRVGFVYSPRGFHSGQVGYILTRLLTKTGADVLVGMDAGHHDAFGPDLVAVDAAYPERHYAPRWTDLRQTLGMRVPYWPDGLTIPDEMAKWRPGNSTVYLQPRHPELDTRPLLDLVVASPDNSPVSRTALQLARAIDAQAAQGARNDIELLNKCHDRDAITLAADLREGTEASEVEEWVRREGWLQILDRTDDGARQCVDLALRWDGGRYFPFSSPNQIDPATSPEAAEFVKRLQPAPETVCYQVFGREITDYLQDPATGLPAVRTVDDEIWAALPQRLPATTPLGHVILRDHQVWIRTSDGTLYLAPEDGSGLTWGYRGNGPTTLAKLLNRLLDDINAPAVFSLREDGPVPPGLLSLIQRTPQDEDAVFTRTQLITARGDDA